MFILDINIFHLYSNPIQSTSLLSSHHNIMASLATNKTLQDSQARNKRCADRAANKAATAASSSDEEEEEADVQDVEEEATLYFNVCVSDVLDDMGAGAREPINDGLLRSGFPFYIEDCWSNSDEHERRACETLPIYHLSPDGLKMTAKELQTYLACCEASYDTGEMPECYDWWDADKFDAFQTKVIKEATKAYAFLSKSMGKGRMSLLKVALGKPKKVIKKKVKKKVKK